MQGSRSDWDSRPARTRTPTRWLGSRTERNDDKNLDGRLCNYLGCGDETDLNGDVMQRYQSRAHTSADKILNENSSGKGSHKHHNVVNDEISKCQAARAGQEIQYLLSDDMRILPNPAAPPISLHTLPSHVPLPACRHPGLRTREGQEEAQ
ncbi:hypothetical protein E2C01_006272 [Portunus trituberculatus]|uniref:Uncharacterized protein n=1 Tax=Portunus trituberculatus TaxID=210409 RepID=A0A5B7CXP8_PORTR|nr:hypothetical protein [Portunus trituberculatus]